MITKDKYIVIVKTKKQYHVVSDDEVFEKYNTKQYSIPYIVEVLRKRYPTWRIVTINDKDYLVKNVIKTVKDYLNFTVSPDASHYDAVIIEETTDQSGQSINKQKQIKMKTTTKPSWNMKPEVQKGADFGARMLFGSIHLIGVGTERVLHQINNGVSTVEGHVRHAIGAQNLTAKEITAIRRGRTDYYLDQAIKQVAQLPTTIKGTASQITSRPIIG